MTKKPETVKEEDLNRRKDGLYYKKYAKVPFTGTMKEFRAVDPDDQPRVNGQLWKNINCFHGYIEFCCITSLLRRSIARTFCTTRQQSDPPCWAIRMQSRSWSNCDWSITGPICVPARSASLTRSASVSVLRGAK